VSPADRHGYFSLGCHAEYAAAFIGEVPFFVEVNPRMPRTFGENQLHLSQVVGWCEAEVPLVELPSRPSSELDRRIASFIAERIPAGTTLQVGIGSVPHAGLELPGGQPGLGIHTEPLCAGFAGLAAKGAVTPTRERSA